MDLDTMGIALKRMSEILHSMPEGPYKHLIKEQFDVIDRCHAVADYDRWIEMNESEEELV